MDRLFTHEGFPKFRFLPCPTGPSKLRRIVVTGFPVVESSLRVFWGGKAIVLLLTTLLAEEISRAFANFFGHGPFRLIFRQGPEAWLIPPASGIWPRSSCREKKARGPGQRREHFSERMHPGHPTLVLQTVTHPSVEACRGRGQSRKTNIRFTNRQHVQSKRTPIAASWTTLGSRAVFGTQRDHERVPERRR